MMMMMMTAVVEMVMVVMVHSQASITDSSATLGPNTLADVGSHCLHCRSTLGHIFSFVRHSRTVYCDCLSCSSSSGTYQADLTDCLSSSLVSGDFDHSHDFVFVGGLTSFPFSLFASFSCTAKLHHYRCSAPLYEQIPN